MFKKFLFSLFVIGVGTVFILTTSAHSPITYNNPPMEWDGGFYKSKSCKDISTEDHPTVTAEAYAMTVG